MKSNKDPTGTLAERDEEEDEAEFSMISFLTTEGSMRSVDGGRRLSRRSMEWFQQETSLEVGPLPVDLKKPGSRRMSGLIGRNGEIRDDFIVKRQSINKPTLSGKLKTMPMLADLTAAKEIHHVDGWVLTQLIVSGYAKMSTKIDELNKINVFPIADGDTGANMKVCLKLPARNLVLDPESSILVASSNMAADVLLNGQGNSGTILSHFFVSLAEEVRDIGKESMSIDEFATALIAAGAKMSHAVPDPVEGTLLSVSRDACLGLQQYMPFAHLGALLEAWNTVAQEELKLTPDKLIVDGVKVLAEAGVVDSGAQGFVYCIEGMYLASQGKLPEALDPTIFQPAKASVEDEGAASIHVDHTVTDSKFQYCTEGVVLLKDGMSKKDVLDAISSHTELGDSIACVGAPAKEGGDMVKIHIHSNSPEDVFSKLLPFSRDPILKKEKVEDMWAMREHAHGDTEMFDLTDAKFTVMGLCDLVLPPAAKSPENFTLPVFMVPSTTQEPLDTRFLSDSEACNVLNSQRHKHTATRYTTAASNPMQLKIELLAALSKGLPLLIFLLSKEKRVSVLGQNVMTAVSMLSPEQQDKIKVLVHGWGFYEAPLLMKALECAAQGKTLEEAYEVCKHVSDRTFIFASFASSATIRKLLAWRPGLFPQGFTVADDEYFAAGLDPVIRDGEPLNELQKAGMLFQLKSRATSLEALEDMEVQRIQSHLKPGQTISNLMVPCCGRPDYGKRMVEKIQAAGIPLSMDSTPPIIYNMGFAWGVATSSWGEYLILYTIEEEA